MEWNPNNIVKIMIGGAILLLVIFFIGKWIFKPETLKVNIPKQNINNTIKFILVLNIVALTTMIVITFIVNPEALHPEKNQLISQTIGQIIGSFSTLIGFFFGQKTESEADKDEDIIRILNIIKANEQGLTKNPTTGTEG